MNHVKRNWKTTITGIASIALVGWQIYRNPASVADPQTLAAVAAGIGLIAAKDGDVSGPPPAPAA